MSTRDGRWQWDQLIEPCRTAYYVLMEQLKIVNCIVDSATECYAVLVVAVAKGLLHLAK
jgi:hypothetical protein